MREGRVRCCWAPPPRWGGHQRAADAAHGPASPRCALASLRRRAARGRILRQGNECEDVEVFRYVTEGSFDSYMWQTLETKARFIAQVMKGDQASGRWRMGTGGAVPCRGEGLGLGQSAGDRESRRGRGGGQARRCSRCGATSAMPTESEVGRLPMMIEALEKRSRCTRRTRPGSSRRPCRASPWNWRGRRSSAPMRSAKRYAAW